MAERTDLTVDFFFMYVGFLDEGTRVASWFKSSHFICIESAVQSYPVCYWCHQAAEMQTMGHNSGLAMTKESTHSKADVLSYVVFTTNKRDKWLEGFNVWKCRIALTH